MGGGRPLSSYDELLSMAVLTASRPTCRWCCCVALRRGIAGCLVQTGREEINVDPAGHLAVCGRADGRNVVVDGMPWRTSAKSDRYAVQPVVHEPLDAA